MYSADSLRVVAYKGGDFLPTWLVAVVISAVAVLMLVLALRRKNEQ
ncbi:MULTISPECIES: hypothetical protein [Streptomyces]|uniref:Uncharacterized protein n=2 Tax=Streptomyces rochei TaxID=1928 RepID=A0AAX3ZTN4_STRRO|nr:MULTISPECIES: hypothetical protein [Streptomyces]WDI22815.1 hypothetical protein PS783_36615 [Streptomyces enissocaesilis]MBQ0877614.1 hypothetical protein [Streptomyces sp. RT42]MBU8553812.1 hypothetical protein [Streptomyces sp. Osf17]MBU8560605.1 hypothetical protein [Streptomyces sp. Babs14]MBX4173615.1 hypothetical protein [Streptomyces geysiriensis]